MSKRDWDGKQWAEYFVQTLEDNGWTIEDIDESLMLGWFANAQMGMHDRITAERDRLRVQVRELEGCCGEYENQIKALDHANEDYHYEVADLLTQLTTAKEAMGDCLELTDDCCTGDTACIICQHRDWFRSFIKGEVRAKLDGEDHHCWAAPDNIDHCGYCGRKFEGEGVKHPTARPQPLE